MGSFLVCICWAICSSTRLPETWCGRSVMTTSPLSRTQRARMRSEPRPVSYICRRSLRGVMISARVGKSGPLMCSHSWSTVASGSSSRRIQAAVTSRTLWGGMSVAIPTAMPVVPFSSTWGRRAGSTEGSSMVPSKLGVQSTVPCPSSPSSTSAKGARRDSV